MIKFNVLADLNSELVILKRLKNLNKAIARKIVEVMCELAKNLIAKHLIKFDFCY